MSACPPCMQNLKYTFATLITKASLLVEGLHVGMLVKPGCIWHYLALIEQEHTKRGIV